VQKSREPSPAIAAVPTVALTRNGVEFHISGALVPSAGGTLRLPARLWVPVCDRQRPPREFLRARNSGVPRLANGIITFSRVDVFNNGAQPRCPDDLDTKMRDIAGVWECPACGGQLVLAEDSPQPKLKGSPSAAA